MSNTIHKRSDCPISCALDVFGDKWSLLIMRNIMLYDLHTYGDFLKLPEKISTNILADRLVMLESAGLISKQEHPESKAKIYYSLTSKGIDLLPAMLEIGLWGDKYFETSAMSKEIIKAAKKDRAGFIKTLSAKLAKSVRVEIIT